MNKTEWLALVIGILIVITLLCLWNTAIVTQQTVIAREQRDALADDLRRERADYQFMYKQYLQAKSRTVDTTVVVAWKMTPETTAALRKTAELEMQLWAARELNRRMAEALK